MMDRRFLLALALSAIVIILTESLFPTAIPGRGPHGADSAAVAAATHAPGRGGNDQSATPPATSATSPANAPVAGVQNAAAAVAASGVPPAAAETLTVTTPRTRVSLSSAGAAPVAVTMRDSRSTVRSDADSASRPQVELARA